MKKLIAIMVIAAALGACAGNAPNAPDMHDMDMDVHEGHGGS